MSKSPIDLDSAIGFNLHIAAFVMKQTLKAALKEADLPLTTEEVVLLMLISTESTEQAELQQRLHKDKTNITRLLDRLADKGLITRERSETSRRQQIMSLTELGIQTKMRAGQLLQSFSQRAAQDISPEAYTITVNTLQQLMNNLTQ